VKNIYVCTICNKNNPVGMCVIDNVVNLENGCHGRFCISLCTECICNMHEKDCKHCLIECCHEDKNEELKDRIERQERFIEEKLMRIEILIDENEKLKKENEELKNKEKENDEKNNPITIILEILKITMYSFKCKCNITYCKEINDLYIDSINNILRILKNGK